MLPNDPDRASGEQRLALRPGILRLMMRRYQEDGASASVAELGQTNSVLGRAPRSYRAFAEAAAAEWAESYLCGVGACDVGPASWHGSGTQDPSGACW